MVSTLAVHGNHLGSLKNTEVLVLPLKFQFKYLGCSLGTGMFLRHGDIMEARVENYGLVMTWSHKCAAHWEGFPATQIALSLLLGFCSAAFRGHRLLYPGARTRLQINLGEGRRLVIVGALWAFWRLPFIKM